MSKGSSRPATSVTTYNIPDYVTANAQEVFNQAGNFNPQVYQGARFADVNPYESQQVLGLAGLSSAPLQQYQDTISGILGSNVGDPQMLREQYNTPMGAEYLNTVINDRLADVTNDITSQYATSGRLGSDAFGTALGRGIGSSIAPLLQQQENLEAQRRQQLANQIMGAELNQANLQSQVAGMIPQTQNLELQRLSALGTAGDLLRSQEERGIMAAQQQIAEQNQADAARLNALLSAAGAGNIQLGSTTTQTQATNPLGDSLLGAGLLARSLLPF